MSSEKNRFLSYIWLLEKTQAGIGFRDDLFEADKRIKHIQILDVIQIWIMHLLVVNI
jgi:hypothetical protein